MHACDCRTTLPIESSRRLCMCLQNTGCNILALFTYYNTQNNDWKSSFAFGENESCQNFPKNNNPSTVSQFLSKSKLLHFFQTVKRQLLSSFSKLMANRTRAGLHSSKLLIAQSCVIRAWHCEACESPGRDMRQATMKSSSPQYASNKQRGRNRMHKRQWWN